MRVVGVLVVGIEIAVGYVFAWAVRKGRRVAGRADGEVDRVLDAAMDRLDGLIDAKLGADAALVKTREEAADGAVELSERTRRRLTDALTDAAESDVGFAAALGEAVAAVQKAAGVSPVVAHGDRAPAIGTNSGIIATGDNATITQTNR